MTGVKEVTLRPTPIADLAEPSAATRRSIHAVVEQITARLVEAQHALDLAAEELEAATVKHAMLAADVRALTVAYDLVKPPPRMRTRTKKGL